MLKTIIEKMNSLALRLPSLRQKAGLVSRLANKDWTLCSTRDQQRLISKLLCRPIRVHLHRATRLTPIASSQHIAFIAMLAQRKYQRDDRSEEHTSELQSRQYLV